MRVRNEQIFLLTWTAGCSDAISYLGLGHVFTANMTGNTVLLGLDIEQGEALAVLRSAVALGGFCLGAYGGTFLLEGNQERATWTPRVTTAIAIEGVLLAVFAVIWLLTGANPSASVVVNALIALSALAMGLQSVIVLSLRVAGIATTYITGTLTNLMAGVARWTRTRVRAAPRKKEDTGMSANERGLGRLAAVWIIYVFSALVSGAAVAHFPTIAAFLPLVALVLIILDAFWHQHAHQHPSTDHDQKGARQ
jgi:uncharacterized membrane protein YoaK (UPF0700 family)